MICTSARHPRKPSLTRTVHDDTRIAPAPSGECDLCDKPLAGLGPYVHPDCADREAWQADRATQYADDYGRSQAFDADALQRWSPTTGEDRHSR